MQRLQRVSIFFETTELKHLFCCTCLLLSSRNFLAFLWFLICQEFLQPANATDTVLLNQNIAFVFVRASVIINTSLFTGAVIPVYWRRHLINRAIILS